MTRFRGPKPFSLACSRTFGETQYVLRYMLYICTASWVKRNNTQSNTVRLAHAAVSKSLSESI